VAQRPTILRTPENVYEAITQAECELKQPLSGKTETAHVAPTEIKTRPELFQPRGVSTRQGRSTLTTLRSWHGASSGRENSTRRLL
jgi:hypothetical protein